VIMNAQIGHREWSDTALGSPQVCFHGPFDQRGARPGTNRNHQIDRKGQGDRSVDRPLPDRFQVRPECEQCDEGLQGVVPT
jgi:hypothetical protein